eukprot:Phypoly_transcript_26278.p1 GENE.Phypoly_transcript_26278~~Phypoly_transcript_26278.p1  ORF type:complete len:151 (+),score=2.81 Phypoly_transcript_26278:68-454(+)
MTSNVKLRVSVGILACYLVFKWLLMYLYSTRYYYFGSIAEVIGLPIPFFPRPWLLRFYLSVIVVDVILCILSFAFTMSDTASHCKVPDCEDFRVNSVLAYISIFIAQVVQIVQIIKLEPRYSGYKEIN